MTDKLYRILIVYREVPLNLNFFYKSEEAGRKMYEALKWPDGAVISHMRGGTPEVVEITDDFGNLATIDRSTLSTVVLTDVAEDMKAQSEAQILQAKEQKTMQERARREGLTQAPQITVPQPRPGHHFRS